MPMEEQNQSQPLLHYEGTHMETMLHIYYMCVGDVCPVHGCSLVGGLVTVSTGHSPLHHPLTASRATFSSTTFKPQTFSHLQ